MSKVEISMQFKIQKAQQWILLCQNQNLLYLQTQLLMDNFVFFFCLPKHKSSNF